MAWTGTYSQKILSTLNNLADSKYDSQYKGNIESTADKISNYGDYNSAYKPMIDDTTNKMANYGEYTSKYQPQIDDTTGKIANYGDYSSKYQPQIDSLMGQLSDWKYDPEGDAEYQAYKNQYTNLGNQAMKDTLGQVSARTGGLASSYAGSAAQQAYGGYMQQLANIIPQLSDKAYNRAANTLGMYQSADNTDYGRWQNALQNLYAQNSMYQGLDATDYGRWADAFNRLGTLNNMYQNLDATDYGRWRDALQELYSQNGMYLNMDQNAFNQWQGQQNSQYDLLSALYKQDDRERADYAAELAAASGGGYGGGGYGGGSGSSSSGTSSSSSSSGTGTTYGYAQKNNAQQTADFKDAASMINSLMYSNPGANLNTVANAVIQQGINNGMTKGEATRAVNQAKRVYSKS